VGGDGGFGVVVPFLVEKWELATQVSGYLNAFAVFPSPLEGEGGFAKRNTVRGSLFLKMPLSFSTLFLSSL
jgi:hypothetical protein